MHDYFLKSPPRSSRQARKFSRFPFEDEARRGDDAASLDEHPDPEIKLHECATDDDAEGTACSVGSGIGSSRSRSVDEGRGANDRRDERGAFGTARDVPPKKRPLRPSYPLLPPSPSLAPPSERERDGDGGDIASFLAAANGSGRTLFGSHSLRVEMAKSAFLKEPCRERWTDLVRSFQVEKARRRRAEEGGDGREDGEADGEADGGEGEDAEGAEPSGADFDEEEEPGEAATELASDAAPSRSFDGGLDDCDGRERNVELDVALSRLESSVASLEEKAARILRRNRFDSFDGDGGGARSEERREAAVASPEARSEEKEGSPPPETRVEEAPPTAPERRKKIATSSGPRAYEHAYVLGEVSYWERRIGRYDQRNVNVVAAAWDEARDRAKWTAGRVVVEAKPSSSPEGVPWSGDEEEGKEEVLYVV